MDVNPAPAPVLDLGRLPIPGPHFVGREKELARLDAAWADAGTHVIALVAFGGVGKSALVARWLDGMAADGWRGATRVLDWSFYSQGSEDRVASAEGFVDHALRFFGDADPTKGSLHDRGRRLAELIRKEKTLLILDGIEPLQYPPGRPEVEGRLKDPGLRALLMGLAAGNPGLCVVTTRERLADLAGWARTAPQVELEELEKDAAVALLKALGVEGTEKELGKAVEDFQRHALTLTLLANYLRRAHGGDVRKRNEIELRKADEKAGGHAGQVVAASLQWLGDGPAVAILRLLGLFQRPAEPAAIKALLARPAILGLTEKLVDLSEEDWWTVVTTLCDHGLIHQHMETLDTHPLIRSHFAAELEKKGQKSWVEGNLRLFKHLSHSAPDLPDTLEEMQPLYAAIVHGCRAGLQQEVLEEVYWQRILRGKDFYSGHRLGAFGSELTALAGFFDRPWSQPSARLTEEWRAFVLNDAAFSLRALGRLTEAVDPMLAGLEARIAQESWKNAAISASNLSELTLTLGDVPRAAAFGEQSVELADRSGDSRSRMITRTAWADALHQAGRIEESAAAFREAEGMQAKLQYKHHLLYSLRGFQYCDLLLGRAEPQAGTGLDGIAEMVAGPEATRQFMKACHEILVRARQTLEWAERAKVDRLSVALDNLTLGRAHLGLALTMTEGDRAVDLAQAGQNLDRAILGLRGSGQEDDIPRGFLARAALRRFLGDFPGAEADLKEALESAEMGRMSLFECDAHLEWARLRRSQGDFVDARRQLARAQDLMMATGYRRREREVVWLAGVLTTSVNRTKSTFFGEVATMTTPGLRFRVALSFPGERRSDVEPVAEQLAAAVGRELVLYDRFHRGKLARPDLDVYLPGLYREQSDLIVLFLGPDYAKKRWCRLEWRHIRQLIATVEADRIMFLSFGSPGDLSELGILPGDGYADVEGCSAQEIAELILERMEGRPGTSAASPGAAVAKKDPASGNPKALALWREKLEFLETQEVLAVDVNQKFALGKQIEEARRKVREYGG